MKKAYYVVNLMIAVLLAASFSAFGQAVPNGNFEAWDTGISYPRATGWDSPNEVIATSLFSTNYVVFNETTAPASGVSSAKLMSKSISIPFSNPISIPGFMTLGDFNVNLSTQTYTITGGVPFTDRPDKLTGIYKYAPTGTDVCLVQVLLLNYNAATQTVIDTIGEGVFLGQAAAAYTAFEAPIVYSSTDAPNYMNINVLSSGTSSIQVGSVLYVDDLEFYTAPVQSGDLFFSEYIEGSGNNKGLEIYNPTADTIYLENYQIAQSSNGGGWAYYHTFPVGAKIAPEDVWVIIANQTNPAFYDQANADEFLAFPSVTHHNGDDARALIKFSGTDTLWLDIIGQPDVDPGTGWAVAGVANATADHTLVRKGSVSEGNTDWAESFGTDANNSEWIVYPSNTFTYLGFHLTGATAPALEIDAPAENSTVYSADVTVELDVENFMVDQPSAGDGYITYTLDAGTAVPVYNTIPFTLNGLAVGPHQLIVNLVDNTGAALNPAVADTVDFSVALNPEANIVSFMIPGQIGNSIINNSTYSVLVFMPAGTVLNGLIPDITVSTDASINPLSGVAQDFTSPVTYTVTAQSGAIQAWVVTVSFEAESDLFFSEYVEGSSNNKALEIYNPTPNAVSLDSYRIAQSTNGGGWAFYHTFPAGATIAPGDVWVIITDQFDGTLFAASGADEVLTYPSVTHHNGDDARAIIKLLGTDTLFVDIIGVPTVDPGTGWDVAGVAAATANHTLIRKEAVVHGNTDWAMAAGTDSISSEWYVNAIDYINLGVHYTGGNLAPVVSAVTLLPAAVTATDTVIIAAQVDDTDGTVVSVTFDWGLDGINFPNVMTLTQLFNIYSIYPDAIPAHAQGTTVYFRFIATDDLGAVTTYNGSYTVAVDPTVLTIYEIQGQAAASPYANVIVTTSGIVTSLLPGTSQGYFIQDGDGAWNGVFVYDNVNLPAIGDEIQITATVSEYYELTEIKTVTAYSVLSSGNALPAPAIVSTLAVNDEQFEGVLVKVVDAECVNDDYGYGMWQVNDGTGASLIHNNANFTFTPNLGTRYDVTGVLNYTFSEWKIELRMASDVSVHVSVDENNMAISRVYPNPVNATLNISLNQPASSIEVYNLLGEKVFGMSALQADTYSIDMSSLDAGVYMVAIQLPSGTRETARIVKQ